MKHRRLLPSHQARSPRAEWYMLPFASFPSRTADSSKTPQCPQILHKAPKDHRKRDREQKAGNSSPQDQDKPLSKQPRTSALSCTTEAELQKKAESDTSKSDINPVKTWIQTRRWPEKYFEQGSQAGEGLFERMSWQEEHMEQSSIPVVQYMEINGIKYPRPIKKLPTTPRRKQSDTSLTGSSNQNKSESKIAPYRDNRYTVLLAAKGIYMKKSNLGITETSRTWCTRLLNSEQIVPEDSLFRSDLFEETCGKAEERNEARIIQDIARLIVPSAETLATYGARHLDHLIENINEGWTEGIPVEGPRPQPDYSVGFRRSAFTDQQLKRLDPLIGSVYDTSFFVATYRLYFPFLTCEVKCGAAALDIADRQNAHSMTLAVRSVVELFRLVKREMELHREILAFSISHDHRAVRIYGYYPVIDGHETRFYRHPIHEFIFTALEGREKWRAYTFTKNVYDVWMPIHLKLICSVIDQLPPDINFEVLQGSEFQPTEASGLSQEFGNLLPEPSNIGSASRASPGGGEVAPIIPYKDTPDTSLSRGKEQGPLKRPKRKRATK